MGKHKYEGTQTEKNLMEAFAGESQARNKYTYFASKAKKEGFEQIAALFEKTAANEKEHAKMWFKELQGIGTTAENLEAAADGENYGLTCMKALQRLPKKKALKNWPENSEWSLRSKSTMKKDTVLFLRMLRLLRSSKRAKSRSGSAETAGTSLSVLQRLKFARCAIIRKLTLKYMQRIIDPIDILFCRSVFLTNCFTDL